VPLFASKKDSRFIKNVTQEVMNRIISLEVKLYKLALNEMEVNLYNESDKKVYHNPVRLYCQTTEDESAMADVDTGLDVTQTITFVFLREDLIDKDVYVEEGDIIEHDGSYYEIDNTQPTQYWASRNNETFLMNVEQRGNRDFGYNPTIKAQAHLTRNSQLNIVDNRVGVHSIKNTNLTNRNL
jgi:hypothetical protein